MGQCLPLRRGSDLTGESELIGLIGVGGLETVGISRKERGGCGGGVGDVG